MAYDKDVSENWQQVVLAATEIWQCRSGQILVTEGTPTDDAQGVELFSGDAIKIASGKTVNYRKTGGSTAALSREAFE